MTPEEINFKFYEFLKKIEEMVNINPSLKKDSPEVKALVEEYNKKGVPIIVLSKEELTKLYQQTMMEKFNEIVKGYNDRGQEIIKNSDFINKNVCKFQKLGYDTIDGRNEEISKKEIDNIKIDMNTMTDSNIWEKYF